MTPKRSIPALPSELDARLRAEPDAAELERMWDLLGEAAPAPAETDADAAWQRLRTATLDRSAHDRARSADRAPDRPAHRRQRSRARWLAPVLAASLAAAGFFYVAVPESVMAPAGAFVTVTLPDGSVAELNSGSRLKYDRRFWRLPFVDAPARSVRLEGEAYFDVVTSARPFLVETADARVRVLGTAFNVRARDAAGTVVTVAEGRVEVRGTDRVQSVLLGAGDRARVVSGVPRVEASGAAQALAWRGRGFATQEQPLAAILAELERRFALDVTLTATDAADDTLTLYFPQPTDAEAILRDICTARELNYRRTSRGFEVY